METKPLEKMTHCELIYALAQYVHPSMYHQVIYLETRWLRALLAYYMELGSCPTEKIRLPRHQLIILHKRA